MSAYKLYAHLLFDTEGIIIPPEDLNFESYLLKYLVIHAENIDWDATQNEVRGPKTMDVHGTLIGDSVVGKYVLTYCHCFDIYFHICHFFGQN